MIDLLSNNENKSDFCNNLYNQLKTKNIDVIYDDRLERAGIKFSDADLIGIPIQIIVGKDFKEKNQLSVKLRENNKEYSVLKENIIKHIEELMQK